MNVTLRIDQCGPLTSLQDRGRIGYSRYGVSQSGPMDRASFALLNAALGNPAYAAAIETSIGGLKLTCLGGSLTMGVFGGAFDVRADTMRLPSNAVFTLETGTQLQIRPGAWGSWCYIGFRGIPHTSSWLGSRAVYTPAEVRGRPFRPGDELTVRNAQATPGLDRGFELSEALFRQDRLRLVVGPQERFFAAKALEALVSEPFKLTPDYDRMGVRLSGPKLEIGSELDMPSEPIVRGSLQVPGHGDPICLLADHQTTGGYPKIGVLISADQDAMVQKRIGDKVRFAAVSPGDAVAAARQRKRALDRAAADLQAQRGGLDDKLRNQNLIGGVVDPRNL
ncbi:MAG: biotin-dependent carboxyltransferase family protein [Pseudomonadota bacterium]